jgi:hypothetical protein
MKSNRRSLTPVFLAAFLAGVVASWLIVPAALAFTLNPPLKVWTTGETLKATDLNSNFSTIANAATRLLVNADFSATGALAHSKLATPALIAKAQGLISAGTDTPPTYAICAASPCLVTAGSKITSVTRVSTGLYNVTLAYTPANTQFNVQAIIVAGGATVVKCRPQTFATSAPQFQITCTDTAAAVADTAFSLVVYDDDN